jgi:hypothetical protein
MPFVDRWAFTGAQLSASGLTVPMKILRSRMKDQAATAEVGAMIVVAGVPR